MGGTAIICNKKQKEELGYIWQEGKTDSSKLFHPCVKHPGYRTEEKRVWPHCSGGADWLIRCDGMDVLEGDAAEREKTEQTEVIGG